MTASPRRARASVSSARPSRCRTGPSRRRARCRGCSSTRSPQQPDEDLEAWSSFAATPRWRSSADDWDDDTDIAEFGDSETRVGALDSGADESASVFVFDDTTEPPTDPAPAVTPIRTGTRSAPAPAPPPAAAAAAARSTTARKQPVPAPSRQRRSGAPGGPAADRDLPVAIGVGVALAVVALVLFSIGPGAAMGLVTLVIAAAAAEFYAAMQKVAYRPATLLGIVACAGLPLATYWRGEGAIPLVLVLSVVFGLLWFLLRRGRRAAGAEPRGHAARRRLRRVARLVRRADPPVPERRRACCSARSSRPSPTTSAGSSSARARVARTSRRT